jgi:hypothetical protein
VKLLCCSCGSCRLPVPAGWHHTLAHYHTTVRCMFPLVVSPQLNHLKVCCLLVFAGYLLLTSADLLGCCWF